VTAGDVADGRGEQVRVLAFSLPRQHPYRATGDGAAHEPTPLDHLGAVLDELVDAGVLSPRRRDGIEFPIWSTVHGLAVLEGQGPLRDVGDATRHHLDELTLDFIDGGLA
jgi:Tetracyclin repressor-like, C-terminal domain